jgi:hypothetical protein
MNAPFRIAPKVTLESLTLAIVYDIETLPNCFTMNVQGLFTDQNMTFEISQYRDDRVALLAWFAHWQKLRIPMIGFNILGFDYPVIHFIFTNPDCTVDEIYEVAQERINDHTGFGAYTVWADDRFAPQIDVYKIMHFDNQAKRTSLKALQFAMRSQSVLECPLPWDAPVSDYDAQRTLIPYNDHDTGETKQFALFILDAIKFRIELAETLKGDVLNFNDSKIGSKILEQRLGEKVCYEWEGKRKVPRQTKRDRIALNDIIFPYIKFNNPEFNRILTWMRAQTLSADDLAESDKIQTKGVFKGVHANVGGVDFHFGTGGLHGSVSAQRFVACEDWLLIDIDVAQLYPQIAIQNRLFPEHLGEAFIAEYAKLPAERKDWQKKAGKKSVQANSLKLAANGTYGNSNNAYSVFYDPRFTMAITINGQLMLAMLVEWLLTVPTLQIIQANTDGITYRIHRSQTEHAEIVRDIWMRLTRLVLEEVRYSRMWIRDVNNYIAEPIGLKSDAEYKQKGAYWYPRVFPADISNAQPPAWHKDFSAQIVIMAAVEHMTKGVDLEQYIYSHRDPFDFMCRAKVDRSSKLMIGTQEMQRITRYYIATEGASIRKVSPPAGPEGEYKRKSGLTDREYHTIAKTVAPGVHDPRIHTKNKSRYETRVSEMEAGYLVAECNVASKFDFARVNYDWYVQQARKLVI